MDTLGHIAEAILRTRIQIRWTEDGRTAATAREAAGRKPQGVTRLGQRALSGNRRRHRVGAAIVPWGLGIHLANGRGVVCQPSPRRVVGPKQNQRCIWTRRDHGNAVQNRAACGQPQGRIEHGARGGARREVLARENQRLLTGCDFHFSADRLTASAITDGQGSIAVGTREISKRYEH